MGAQTCSSAGVQHRKPYATLARPCCMQHGHPGKQLNSAADRLDYPAKTLPKPQERTTGTQADSSTIKSTSIGRRQCGATKNSKSPQHSSLAPKPQRNPSKTP